MARIAIQHLYEVAIRHHGAGELAKAETLYRAILSQNAREPDALHLLGVLCHQSGRPKEALNLVEQAIAGNPRSADYHSNLGLILSEAGSWDAAVSAQRRAIELAPNHVAAHNNLGLALQGRGELLQAIAAFRRTLELQPNYAPAHFNLANVLSHTGQTASAVASYHRALALQPTYVQAHVGLGNALKDLGEFDSAIAAYRSALKLKPDFLEVGYNIANAFRDADRLDDAIVAYLKVLEKSPDYVDAIINLGNAYKNTSQLDMAINCYQRAVDIATDRHAADNLLIALNYHSGYSAREIWARQVAWNETFGKPLEPDSRPRVKVSDSHRKLKIGYLSFQFRDHYLFRPLIEHHDRAAFEVTCYADIDRSVSPACQVAAHASRWRNVTGMDDGRVADLIRQDGIDILVDLMLHTEGNRLPVLARKPAPVQVTWLAYPGTSGMQAVDYRLSDPYLDPPGCDEGFYAERTIRLPNCFWCYNPGDERPEVNALPAIRNGHVTFGCLNNVCKITADTVRLWGRVASAVPESRFLVLAPQGSWRESFLLQLNRAGVDPKRIDFASRLPRSKYLQLYHQIDIQLDPVPCPGHSTTLDSLWMGVPVVTLAGDRAISRAGLSILSNVKLPELVAKSTDQYVQIGVDLASQTPRLSQLRSELRQRMRVSAIMDGPSFARDVEAAYRQMWIGEQ